MTDEPDDVIDAPEQEPEPAKPAYDPDVAEEARFFGWKAPEEWVGDKPAGYIDDPNRFLDRIKDSRIFKASEKRFEDKLNDVTARLSRVTESVVHRQKADYEARLAAINTEQRKAVEVADVQAFERLEKQKQQLTPPPVAEPAQPTVPPVVKDYIDRNDWAKDPVFRMEGAQAIDIALRSGRQFRDEAEQLEYAESVMKRRYPHMFTQASPAVPPRASRVDGGGIAGGAAPIGGAFDKLPAEARQAFKKFVAQGIFADTPEGRKQYMEDYNA